MSYILDALKKVEQKREQEVSPRTLSFLSGEGPTPKKRILWPYLLIAVFALNAVSIIAWFVWYRSPVKEVPVAADEKETRLPVPSSPFPETTGQSEEATKPLLKTARSVDRLAAVPKAALSVPSRGTEQELKSVSRTINQESKGVSAAPIPDDPPRKPAATDFPPVGEAAKEKGISVAGKVYSLSDLPGDVRRALPDFKISGHAYSQDATTRVVRINEKILQEGQDLAPGLRLEEIVPDGVVMSHNGVRFRVGLSPGR
jgi:general secretion pathway protein B